MCFSRGFGRGAVFFLTCTELSAQTVISMERCRRCLQHGLPFHRPEAPSASGVPSLMVLARLLLPSIFGALMHSLPPLPSLTMWRRVARVARKAALTSEVRAMLEGDGLTPLVSPSITCANTC